jgi:uncharacterized protein (DUF1330 family)
MAAIEPDPEKLRALFGQGESPIVMINLLRFRDRAQYPPGSDATPCTGREAYGCYAATALQKVRDVGGRVVWQGGVLNALIAEPGEEWDEAVLVEYPSPKAFLEMVSRPEYQAAVVHRVAALADSRLIATTTRLTEL